MQDRPGKSGFGGHHKKNHPGKSKAGGVRDRHEFYHIYIYLEFYFINYDYTYNIHIHPLIIRLTFTLVNFFLIISPLLRPILHLN